MKKLLKTSFLCILALFIALSVFLVPSVETTRARESVPPTLTAHITKPSDGAIIYVGDCFEVKATITVTCPTLLFLPEGPYWWPFAKPAYAIDGVCCPIAVENVKATISIDGNAKIQGADTKDLADFLSCPNESGECPWTANVTWKVCCTGEGAVTITVEPCGVFVVGNVFTEPPEICDLFVHPAYALDQNMISDSVTIHQVPPVPRENFAKTLFSEGGGNVTTWPRPADNRVINVNVQPRQATVNQPITIYANIANRGEVEGPYLAMLKINGQEEATKTGILQANTAVPLEFVLYKEQPGTYQVDVNGQQTFFTIVGEEKTAANHVNRQLLAFILWGILVIAVATALTIVSVRRKQSY